MTIATSFAGRAPFFYGWVILACACCAGFSRQGPAVATLSIFVDPMTSEFGWSRTALSGAVSIGGVLAAMAAPFIGPTLDSKGPRVVLCLAVLGTAAATALLSLTQSLIVFYLLFCFARMNFAGPYDLGIYGAVSNWFVARRAFAISTVSLVQMAGLVAMPLIAFFAMQAADWRGAWLAVGLTVLVVGFVPTWLFMIRRPEDVGLNPDGRGKAMDRGTDGVAEFVEPAFSRRQALATPSFWLLSLFTIFVFPVQAGVSLHQAPHLIERGLDPLVAATVVSGFSLIAAVVSFGLGFWPRRWPIRLALVASAVALGASAWAMIAISSEAGGYGSAVLFGIGIGGLMTMLPLAWANYFGRQSFGAIRGIALTVQVLAQAAGPVFSGLLRDLTGDYALSLTCFAVLGFGGALAVLFARPPSRPLRD